MKILEITPFSAGICGVWTRVFSEAKLLAKNNDVYIFSSDIERGSGKIKAAKSYEVLEGIKIRRFKTYFRLGQNAFFWNCEKQVLKLKPDLIITHVYRHYYSTLALKIAKKLKIPCFLVTHAPFLDRKLRSWYLNIAVFLYDCLIGKRILNKYEKIIAITRWEIPHLLRLGVEEDKIIYIPNGIPEQFFKIKKEKEKKNTVLFLGRITLIKDIETLLKAVSEIENISLTLVGPIEEPYGDYLLSVIKKLKMNSKIKILPAVYDLKEKIKIIDRHEIFVLPSKREGMPIALIEAMSRGKIVISSKTDGGKEIINQNKNGFLFDIGNSEQLAKILAGIQKMSPKNKIKIKKQAEISARRFSLNKTIKKLQEIIKK